jgi:hypothetical protein
MKYNDRVASVLTNFWRAFLYILLQAVAPAHAGSLADFFLSSTLKMETIFASETSVKTISTRGHIQEECFLHGHRRENLKCYSKIFQHFMEHGS